MGIVNNTVKYFKNNGLVSTASQAYLKTGLAVRKSFYGGKSRLGAYVKRTRSGWNNAGLPLISVLVCCTKNSGELKTRTITSLNAQFYDELEIGIIDLKSYKRTSDTLICRALNNAALAAKGEYIIFMNAGDVLAEGALLKLAVSLSGENPPDMIYTDEIVISGKDTGKRSFPIYKPDFAPDYLESYNYIGNFIALKKSFFDIGEGFSDGRGKEKLSALIMQAYRDGRKIEHISEPLYYRYVRDNVFGSFRNNDSFGTKKKSKEKPLVSIIVPTSEHTEDLRRCIESFEEKSDYRKFEWIIVENNSKSQECFEYYKELEKKKNVKILYFFGRFNFSKLVNYGAGAAKGDYLLLLNNDTELIEPHSLEKMLELAVREKTGAVGAKLLYPDNTVQHAGIIVGAEGLAGNAFVGRNQNDRGYMRRLMYRQDYSAVTGACLLTSKTLFRETGGFDESLAVNFNDVDYCLKLREKGLSVIYEPGAVLYHYESKSRGLDNDPEKASRFHKELKIFEKRYRKLLAEGDPFYNKNLLFKKADFKPKKVAVPAVEISHD